MGHWKSVSLHSQKYLYREGLTDVVSALYSHQDSLPKIHELGSVTNIYTWHAALFFHYGCLAMLRYKTGKSKTVENSNLKNGKN